MRGRIKEYVAGALLGCLTVAVPVLADETRDLKGVYSCQGKNPDGGEYSGKVIIFRKENAYILLWGGELAMSQGVAIREGDLLCSSWALVKSEDPRPVPGIVVYKIQPDRKLVGRWTDKNGIMGSETLTFLSEETESVGSTLNEISIL